MSDRQKEIDDAFRRASRTMFWTDVRKAKKGWLLLLVAFVGAIAFLLSFAAMAPPHLIETIEARGVSEFGIPSKYFPGRRSAVARLGNGVSVTFDFPRSGVFRAGEAMNLRHYERNWGPIHYEWYRFDSYAKPEA